MKVRERRRRETTQNESELTEIGSFRRKGRKTSHIGAASPLPIGVRLYLVVTCLLGIVCATLVFTRLSLPLRTGSTAELIVFIVLSALAGNSRVLLPGARKGSKEAETGTLSLGFAMIFVTMLRFGPQGALLAGFASTVASSLRPRQPWYQFLFNIAVDLIRTSVAGTAFLLVNGGTLELRSWTAVSSVGVACLSFFAIHTGMMAIMVGGFSGRSPISIWRESFLRTAPSYVIAAAVSTVASVVIGNKLLATLLCAVPIALLTHASFRSYLKHAADLIDSKEELATLYLATIRSLALAIDAKDQYTHQHILRVQQYAVATALALNIDGDELKAIETGALLHDIGKLGVPEYVLLKPGRLTEEEYAKIREHPRIGADILDPVKFPWPVLPVVKHHHERWDGSGYPDGLRGESIPRTARILSVADVYDALTSSRSYRAAWSHERAMREIRRNAGTQFDPEVVKAFEQVVDSVRIRIARAAVLDAAANGNSGRFSGAITTPRSAEAVRQIQRSSSELWALYEVSQTLSASLGLDDTLEILGRKLLAIFPDTGCVILLSDGAPEEAEVRFLRSRIAVGLNHEFFTRCHTLGLNSLSARVARQRTTYVGGYDHEDLMPVSQTGTPWYDIGTALIVPIVHQGTALGTINLYHAEENAFSDHIRNLLETIAQRASLALYNGLLYDRTRSHANTDPLTGLANVRCVTEWMENRIQNLGAQEARFALLCLDLDSFKPINDNFGHQKGDTVLQDLARIFRNIVRDADLVGRNGGDEFVVLLNEAGTAEATLMAKRIQAAVQQYDPNLIHPRLGALRLGVSIGYACYPTDGRDVPTLLSVADAGMYKNKTERKLKQLVENERAEGPKTTTARNVPPDRDFLHWRPGS